MAAMHSSDSTTSLCPPSPTTSSEILTMDVLRRQDDVTSTLTFKMLKDDPAFNALSAREGRDLIARDQEDELKLAKGIQISVAKGVLSAHPDVSKTQQINVLGKTADQVANELLTRLPADGAAAVLILTGLSGTGKGTTVAKMQARLAKCICWSNGNVFRSVTHLVNEALGAGKELTPEFLTPALFAAIFSRLSFKQFGSEFDVVIDDTVRVSTIANTLLKTSLVSTRVPTIAEQTQGEVVVFAAKAIAVLREAGHNVILEGRAQTLNHIATPYRFELVIPDVSVLGSRRAAQRVMAAALEKLKAQPSPTSSDVAAACLDAAATLK